MEWGGLQDPVQRLWWILYVGQTKRSLAVRLKEHQKAVFVGDKSDKNTSALAEHALDTRHTIDWDNAS